MPHIPIPFWPDAHVQFVPQGKTPRSRSPDEEACHPPVPAETRRHQAALAQSLHQQVSDRDMHLVTANIWGDEAPQTQTA